MNPNRVLIVAFLLLLFPSVATRADKVDDYIEAVMKKRQIPGLSLAVVKDGEVIKAKGYGLANLEHNVPVTTDSVFELASTTKPFTATAIMMLVEEGRVGLDDKISKYLLNTPDSWREITVRHMLTHTAGFASNCKEIREQGWLANYTTAEMFEAGSKCPLDFAPGERYQYSDQGYFFLGMIIEKVSGKRYREFMRERIFQPVGMTATTVIDQWEIIENRAAGYRLRNGKLAHIRRISQFELPSHFGILSTVKDVAKWDAALYTEKLLKKVTLDQMWTPVILNNGIPAPANCGFYGFGWCLEHLRGHRVVQHVGGSGTALFRLPDDRLTVIVLTNIGYGNYPRYSWLIAQAVAGLYNPLLTPPHRLKAQPDPDPQRTQMLRSLLSDMVSGAQESPLMTPGLRVRIAATTPKARAALAARPKDNESFTFLACDGAQERPIERFDMRVSRICYYKLVTEQETRYVTFYLTVDGKVADIRSTTD